MGLPGRAYRPWILGLVAVLILTACNTSGDNGNSGDNPPATPTAKARKATNSDDLLQGPLARSSEGDYVLENDLLRVIIRKPGRNWFGLGTYGGNIIDVSAKNADASFNPDHMEEFVTGVNIENTTISNTSRDALSTYLVEYLNGSGEVEAFQPFAGFGEPQLTLTSPETSLVACDAGQCDQCNYLAYTGKEGAAGVSVFQTIDATAEPPTLFMAGHSRTDTNGHYAMTLIPPQSQVDLSTKRLDPNLGNAFDDGFDALEVWIGADGRNGIFDKFLGQNAGDWFNLINQGLVRTAVANSDSHDRRITYVSTRNLIASAETDPGRHSDIAEDLAATVAEGKVAGSNGPFIAINAGATYLGVSRTAGLGLDEPLQIPISSGTSLTIRVDVSTPAWASVDSVDFYVNNQPELTSDAGLPTRYGVCPNYTISAGYRGWKPPGVVNASCSP